MERFFEKDKIILTGNPVRQGLLNHTISREEAIRSFGLNPEKKVVLNFGRKSWRTYYQPLYDGRT